MQISIPVIVVPVLRPTMTDMLFANRNRGKRTVKMPYFLQYCRAGFLAVALLSLATAPSMAADPKPLEIEKRKNIMPEIDGLRLVLRNKAYIDSRNAAVLKLDDPKSVIVSTPFSPSVVLILVSEQELSSLQIAEHHLVTLNLSREDAIALGRKQVLAQLPTLPGPADFVEGVVVSPKIDYVASLLLTDGWEQLDDALKGRLVAAVPSDDQVILANVDSDKMLEKLKTFVANAYTDASRSISQSLFVRENGAWVELK